MGLEPDCRRRSDAIEFDDICDEDMGIFFCNDEGLWSVWDDNEREVISDLD